MESTGKKTKVIEDFVTKQLELLKEESRAEAQRFQLEYHTFSAVATSTEDDEEVGCLVNFVSLSQEKLKKGDRITTGEKKKAKQGYVHEISSKGFKLSVRKRGTFIVGQEYKFSQAMQGSSVLQDAMVDLHSSEVFKPGESNTRMRDLLLGLAKPRTKSKQQLQFLNPKLDSSQRDAVTSSLIQEDLSIIHGPPGTGKTTTLVEIIQQTVKRGGRVLVCSASHAAVDNLMARLVGGMNKGIIRLGHPAKMDRKHVKYTLQCMVRKKKKPQAQVLSEAAVVFGTLTGCAGDSLVAALPKGHFSLTVVDECGQAMEAAVWGVVRYTSKLLLAGDHLQLPPTILSQKPKVAASLSISLMERLAGIFQHPLVQLLDTQYRMNTTIMTWSSNTFYKGRLKAADTVAQGRLGDLKGVKVEGTAPAILLVDTGGKMVEQSSRDVAKSSLANPGEAEIIFRAVRDLVARGVRPRDIGVISFYALQVDLIRHNLSSLHPEVEVNSVDGFQGQEKEVILLSTVRSNTKKVIGFLKESRRLNVAVTRAKRQLVVVSDVDTFGKDKVFKSFFDYIKIRGEVWDAATFGKPVKIDIPASYGLTKIKIKAKSLVDEKASKELTPVLGMDCEMVGVKGGEVLARVSIVNQHGHCVYDKFVAPTQEVTDYRTWVSGVREKDLVGAPEFSKVQKAVAKMVNGRVIVGHSLDHDFQVLHLDHPEQMIRDTAEYEPFKAACGGKTPSLKNLSAKLLGVKVQTGEHSSVQDSQAAVRLYMMHREEWEQARLVMQPKQNRSKEENKSRRTMDRTEDEKSKKTKEKINAEEKDKCEGKLKIKKLEKRISSKSLERRSEQSIKDKKNAKVDQTEEQIGNKVEGKKSEAKKLSMKTNTKGPKVDSIKLKNDPEFQVLKKLFEALSIKATDSNPEVHIATKKNEPEKKNIDFKGKSKQVKAYVQKKVQNGKSGKVANISNANKPNTCKHCSAICNSKAQLNNHMSSKHNKDKKKPGEDKSNKTKEQRQTAKAG